ncbi:MAG: hypothetical protein B7X98_01465, partial [Methylophilaceae bacterium 17-43-7]
MARNLKGVLIAFAIIFLLFIYPTISNYKFEDTVVNKLNTYKAVITKKKKTVEIHQPLTWFKTQVTYIQAIVPDNQLSAGVTTVTFMVDEEPVFDRAEIDCKGMKISHNFADKNGTFVADENFWDMKLTKEDYDIFCV